MIIDIVQYTLEPDVIAPASHKWRVADDAEQISGSRQRDVYPRVIAQESKLTVAVRSRYRKQHNVGLAPLHAVDGAHLQIKRD